MFAIAVAVFFSALAVASIATIFSSLHRGLVHGRDIIAELLELDRAGKGRAVIALPPLRPRAGGFDRVIPARKPVMPRPMRRSGAAA